MIPLLSILFAIAIILKFLPPKKPNYYFGYQLGSAKKSNEHWKIANSCASNYMIVIYTILLVLAFIFQYKKYDGDVLLLALLIVGVIITYFGVEKRLKAIKKADAVDIHTS